MPYAMINKKEVAELNIMRAIAYLAVVVQSSLIVTNTMMQTKLADRVMIGMIFDVAKFSAPVFIFLAGYTIIAHGTTITSYRNYVWHKGKEIVLPYIGWSIVYFGVLPTLGTHITKSFWLQLFSGDAAPHLWYVIMVFQFHLLAPIFLWLFHLSEQHVTTRKRLATVMAIVAVFYIALLTFSEMFIYNGEQLTTIQSALYIDRSFLAYSFYFVLGGVLAKSMRSFRSFALKMIPANTFIFLFLYFYINYELFTFQGLNDLNLKVSTYVKPSMFFYVLSMLFLLYALSLLIANTRTWLGEILYWISNYTYQAFLGHYLFLMITFAVCRHLAVKIQPLPFAVILFLGSLIGSLVCAYVLKHTTSLWSWSRTKSQETNIAK